MKRTVISAAVLALAIGGAGISQAGAPSGYKVTGGGQIIAESTPGAGDTLAFQAQNIEGATGAEGSDTARGQLQYNGRSGDAPQKFHGTIQCLQVEGNTARIAGTKKTETGETGFFRLLISDTDKGAAQNGTELVLFNPNANDVNCDAVDDEEAEDQLGRGNIVIHDAKASGEPEA